MTQNPGITVTYTGREDPFFDRIYRSGLTFTPGQSRTVPATLAQRFLRHSDVFQPGKSAEELAAEALADAYKATVQAEQARLQAAQDAALRVAADQAQAEAERLAQVAEQAQAARDSEPPKDDTAEVLDQTQKQEVAQRLQEDARFALLDQLDSMDKKALIDWAAVTYKQTIHPNTGEAKVREAVKGFVDQYGMPA